MSPLPPLVLVHGNGENADAWSGVAKRLRAIGHEALFTISLDPPSHGSCIAYAQQLARYIDLEVLPKIGTATPIAIVAHSLGAPVVRYYLSHLGGARLTSHAIYIAGCNAGAPACDIMLLRDPDGETFRQAPEVHTGGSAFLTALAAKEALGIGVRVMTISGPHDTQYVMFEEGPQLPGADNRTLPGLGHWGLREADETFVLMRAFLEDRASALSIGRDMVATPTSLVGTWFGCSPELLGVCFSFGEDGSVERRIGGTISRGFYRCQISPPNHLVDLDIHGEFHQGRYRLSVEGDSLALAIGSPGEPRPENLRLSPLFRRASLDLHPEEVIGTWRSTRPGTQAGIGIKAFCLQLTATGTWLLKSTEGSPGLQASGTWSASYVLLAEGSFRMDLEILQSTTNALARGANWCGLLTVDGDTMQLELPAVTWGTTRPQVIDYPALLIRADPQFT